MRFSTVFQRRRDKVYNADNSLDSSESLVNYHKTISICGSSDDNSVFSLTRLDLLVFFFFQCWSVKNSVRSLRCFFA